MTPEKPRPPQQFTLEEVTRLAQEAALKDGGHVPTVIAQGSGGAVVAQVKEFPGTHEGRMRALFGVGYHIAQSGLVGSLRQVFFITEGWMSVLPKGGTPETLPLPSQDPNRIEVLLIDALTIEGYRSILTILEMLRDDEGNLTNLKPFVYLGEEEKGVSDSPLMDAFVEGFRQGGSHRRAN